MMDLQGHLRGKTPGPDTGIEVRKSICTICDPMTQCGLDLYVKNGKIIKVEGSKENPYSNGTLCPKGAANRQYIYSEDRLRTPLKRTGHRGDGKFEAISWEEALNAIAAKFNDIKQQNGPEFVVFFSGFTKYFRPYLKRLAHSFGSPNYLTESSTCFQAMNMAQQLTFGLPGGPDLMATKCLLVWSPDQSILRIQVQGNGKVSGFEALPVYRPPKYSWESTPELAQAYPFILNTGSRLPMYMHTRTFRLSWTKSLRPNHSAADLNPVDADRLGIKQDDAIRISTPKAVGILFKGVPFFPIVKLYSEL